MSQIDRRRLTPPLSSTIALPGNSQGKPSDFFTCLIYDQLSAAWGGVSASWSGHRPCNMRADQASYLVAKHRPTIWSVALLVLLFGACVPQADAAWHCKGRACGATPWVCCCEEP